VTHASVPNDWVQATPAASTFGGHTCAQVCPSLHGHLWDVMTGRVCTPKTM
jgi:hypothetical protein